MCKRKSKNLYSSTEIGISTQVRCFYNPKTNNIIISSVFIKSSNGTSKTNKSCPTYLGITIAEKMLSKLFNNIEVMPPKNPGFDFICNNGYKIDVKSSTLHNNQWGFCIRYNKTPDYFLCLAFDDRDNLNPQHIWLIPGYILNNQTGANISKSTLNKWEKYEQPIDKAIICCNTMRNNHG